jgi:hypothetical protein
MISIIERAKQAVAAANQAMEITAKSMGMNVNDFIDELADRDNDALYVLNSLATAVEHADMDCINYDIISEIYHYVIPEIIKNAVKKV